MPLSNCCVGGACRVSTRLNPASSSAACVNASFAVSFGRLRMRCSRYCSARADQSAMRPMKVRFSKGANGMSPYWEGAAVGPQPVSLSGRSSREKTMVVVVVRVARRL